MIGGPSEAVTGQTAPTAASLPPDAIAEVVSQLLSVVAQPLLALDPQLCVLAASSRFARCFQLPPEPAGRRLTELLPRLAGSSLLATLEGNPGVSSLRLARVYQLDKTSLSLALKRLAERGLIESNRNAADRRYHALRLTPAGRAVLRRATRHVEAQERAMDAVLGRGERAALLRLLGRIAGVFGR